MGHTLSKKYNCLSTGILLLSSLFCQTFGLAASAETLTTHDTHIVRDDYPRAHGQSALPDIPLSSWRDEAVKPRAVAVCVHGLVMHGRVYERVANSLAEHGFVVYAQDLRGYGRWQEKSYKVLCGDERIADPNFRDQSIIAAEPSVRADDGSKSAEVNYDKSFEDLKSLVEGARHEHPNLPVFLIGESLGAGLSIHAAKAMPGMVDGLVLSSPALKRRLVINTDVVKDYSTIVTNPRKQCDLSPFIKKLSSEDPRIVAEEMADPYVRKHMACKDMVNTFSLIKGNLDYAKGVPAEVPVLVIQGDRDRILKQNAVVLLLERLQCKDQTVRWLPGKGHVLIETALIEPTTLGTIQTWLSEHLPEANVMQASK
jgi:alpha-beta hydrolase superfamily lysophospholipase